MNIKEATPQNRPNYIRQDMAVRDAVGDLAKNSQVHLLGFTKYLTRHDLGQADARNDNSTYKKLAVQWLNKALCFVSSSVVADSFVLRNRQLLVATERYIQNNKPIFKLSLS